jgi:hypothetical protein
MGFPIERGGKEESSEGMYQEIKIYKQAGCRDTIYSVMRIQHNWNTWDSGVEHAPEFLFVSAIE